MATIAAIRTATKTTISAAVSSLIGYDQVADVVNTPAFVVMPDSSDFNMAMGRGTDTHTFKIYVLVSPREASLAQTELDKYVTGGGADSIRAAIFTTPGLGLANTHAHISGMSGYGGSYSVNEITYVGAVLTMTVHTSGVS